MELSFLVSQLLVEADNLLTFFGMEKAEMILPAKS